VQDLAGAQRAALDCHLLVETSQGNLVAGMK
jgi:hypothetical protein